MHHQPKLRNTSYIILSTIISILISYKDMNFKPASLVPVSQFRSFRGRGELALYVIQQYYQSIMLYGLKADVVDGWGSSEHAGEIRLKLIKWQRKRFPRIRPVYIPFRTIFVICHSTLAIHSFYAGRSCCCYSSPFLPSPLPLQLIQFIITLQEFRKSSN